jgi:O-antigen ligase
LILSFVLAVGYVAAQSRRSLMILMSAMVLAVALNAAINIAAFIPNLYETATLDVGRLLAGVGLPDYRNSTNLSAMYAVYMAGAMALIVNAEMSRWLRAALAVAIAVLLTALVMTQARGGLVAVLAVCAMLAVLMSWRTRIWLLVAIALALVVTAIIPELRHAILVRGSSYRPELWDAYLHMAVKQPFFGYGPFANIDQTMHDGFVVDQPHNLVLGAQIRGGVAAALGMLTILAGGVYWSARYWRRTKDIVPLCVAVAMITFGIFDYQVMPSYPAWPWITFWLPFGLWIGVEVVMRGEARAAKGPLPPSGKS